LEASLRRRCRYKTRRRQYGVHASSRTQPSALRRRPNLFAIGGDSQACASWSPWARRSCSPARCRASKRSKRSRGSPSPGASSKYISQVRRASDAITGCPRLLRPASKRIAGWRDPETRNRIFVARAYGAARPGRFPCIRERASRKLGGARADEPGRRLRLHRKLSLHTEHSGKRAPHVQIAKSVSAPVETAGLRMLRRLPTRDARLHPPRGRLR